jgi:hypothetical protein
MAFLAGEIVTAGRLNRLQPVTYEAIASSLLTMTTATPADVPGASVSLTTTADNAAYKVIGVFDAEVLATSTSVLMLGKLVVDGTSQSGVAVYGMDTLDRATVIMTWTGTLGSAGSHTLKLQGNLTASLATGGRFNQGDTKLTATITEVP